MADHEGSHQIVVLDDQDGLVAAYQARLGRLLDRQGDARRLRQVDSHRRAVTFLAVDLDVSMRLFDKSVDHAEAEARPLIDVLGGEKGFEHIVQDRGGNAVPGIGHRDQHVIPGSDIAVRAGVFLVEDDVAGLDGELAAVRHRVAGVERQIENRIGELAGVDQRARRIAVEHHVDLDVLSERRPQQIGGLDHQRIDVDLTRLQRLLAGEGEQALGQIGAARRGVVDHPGDRQKLGPVREGFGEDFDGSGNDGQNIVQVVSDAAGQLTDRFHLLGLVKLQVRDVLFVEQPVLFLDEGLHLVDGNLQRDAPGNGRDRLGQHVGEPRQKIDVILVVVVLLVVVDLEDTVRLIVGALDDDVDDRDDAVRGVKRRRIETADLLQVVDDRRQAGGEGAPLRRAHIGARHHVADDALLPAITGDDEEVVLFGAVAADLAEGSVEAFGTDPDGFGEDLVQIALAKRETAKPGNRSLLAKQLLDLCGGVGHGGRFDYVVADGQNQHGQAGTRLISVDSRNSICHGVAARLSAMQPQNVSNFDHRATRDRLGCAVQ